MLEEVWPAIGNAWVSGVLAGGGSILVQWLAPKVARLLKGLRSAGHPRFERRLAAILVADVVGYSRLMSADEEGTHFRLLAYRREVIAPQVREHRGRIVKHTGDGALVEFGSVVDAVRCALGCATDHRGAQRRAAAGPPHRASHRGQSRRRHRGP